MPAEDACAIIGCIVSFRFSTNIFQLQLCRYLRQPPVISSSPCGERSARLSMDERAVDAVSPGVVGTAEGPAGVARRRADELGALVRAAIEEHPDAAVGLA